MLHRLTRFLPRGALRGYHRLLARASARRYGFPSRRMLVIGVTGTTGKSTVIEFLDAIFRAAGRRVGVASTIRFRVGDRTWLNNEKMTMLGRGRLQRLLREMVDDGCTVAIVETTSEGIAQGRHIGIAYDAALITNLTPEHIESHGSFEAYRAAKEQLFASLTAAPRKEGIPKISVVNLAMPDAQRFLRYPADRRFGFALGSTPTVPEGVDTVVATDIAATPTGMRFRARNEVFALSLPGAYNVANAVAALTVAVACGVSLDAIRRGLTSVTSVPGRFSFITRSPFSVVVDYAHEPAGLETVYRLATSFAPHQLIAVLGAAGGGRDAGKRETLGRLAAQYAGTVIVTNEDPYDEDPRSIMDAVAAGARSSGKRDGESLFVVEDRRAALKKAFSLAVPGDLVLVTGKGSEQSMVIAGGRKIPWSDERVIRELLGVENSADNI